MLYCVCYNVLWVTKYVSVMYLSLTRITGPSVLLLPSLGLQVGYVFLECITIDALPPCMFY